MIEKLLEGNRNFRTNEFNPNIHHYQAIAQAQTPSVLWIGCSDSRVPEHEITASKPGTIFVHRNVANIVSFNDVNIAAIIEYAIKYLKIPDIVVCGHYRCGGIAAILDGVESNYIGDWLLIASGAKEKVDAIAAEQNLTREQKLHLLSEENVRLQLKHLKNLSMIRTMHKEGSIPRLHGWIYCVDDGEIKILVDGREDKSQPLPGGGEPHSCSH